MGSISVRKRQDGSTAYHAQIRIMRKGKTVYQETQTFDRKTAAQKWIKKRETEMSEPGAIDKANRQGEPARRDGQGNDRSVSGRV